MVSLATEGSQEDLDLWDHVEQLDSLVHEDSLVLLEDLDLRVQLDHLDPLDLEAFLVDQDFKDHLGDLVHKVCSSICYEHHLCYCK